MLQFKPRVEKHQMMFAPKNELVEIVNQIIHCDKLVNERKKWLEFQWIEPAFKKLIEDEIELYSERITQLMNEAQSLTSNQLNQSI